MISQAQFRTKTNTVLELCYLDNTYVSRYADRQIATLFRELTTGLEMRMFLLCELQNKVHYLRAGAGLYQLLFSHREETVGEKHSTVSLCWL